MRKEPENPILGNRSILITLPDKCTFEIPLECKNNWIREIIQYFFKNSTTYEVVKIRPYIMRIVEIFFAKAERGHPLKLLLTYLHTVVVVKIFTTNFLQLLACEATSQLLRSSRKNFWPQLHNYGLRGCCFEDESFLGVRLTTSSSKWGYI